MTISPYKSPIIYPFEYYEETCCDVCNEVVHVHFKCPICGEWAGTDYLAEYWPIATPGTFDSEEFTCELCDARFQTMPDKQIVLLETS